MQGTLSQKQRRAEYVHGLVGKLKDGFLHLSLDSVIKKQGSGTGAHGGDDEKALGAAGHGFARDGMRIGKIHRVEGITGLCLPDGRPQAAKHIPYFKKPGEGFHAIEVDHMLSQLSVPDTERPADQGMHFVVPVVFQQEPEAVAAHEAAGPDDQGRFVFHGSSLVSEREQDFS
jgi:hypothetical protein